MKRLISLVFLAVFAACGGGVDKNGDGIADTDPNSAPSPDSITTVAPSSPKGRISGRVTNLQGAGLANATVDLSGPEKVQVKTDDKGFFSADKLSAGSTLGVFVSMTGYAPAWTTATIPAAAGNFPINDAEAFVGVIALLPTTGELTFYVLGYDGTPIEGASAVLDVTPGFVVNRGSNTGYGDISVTGQTQAGSVKFTGIPKVEEAAWMETAGVTVRYSVYVAPVADANGLTYAGKIFSVSAKELLTNPWARTLVLPAPGENDALKVVASNVANLLSATPTLARENLIAQAGTLLVAFNQPIGKEIFVEVRNDQLAEKDSGTVSLNTPELNLVGTELRITPKAPGFQPGQKYNLTIQVSPRDNPAGKVARFSAPFFGGDPAAPKPLGSPTINLLDVPPLPTTPANGLWDPSETIEVNFDKYIGRGDGSAMTLSVYFENDLNNSGQVGDAAGEKGSNVPLCLSGAEPVPGWLAGARASGYTKKFLLAAGTVPGYTKALSATELSVTIAFSESFKCSGGALHQVWGDPLTSTLEKLQVTPIAP